MIDHRGQKAGKCVRWPVRPDTRQPVWNVARGLGLPPLSYRRLRRATLHAQVWHADPLLSDTLMGALALPLRAQEVVAAVAVEFASCALVRCLEFPSRALCNLLRVQARLNKGGVTDALKPNLRRVDDMPHHSRPVIGQALQSALTVL